LIGTYLRSCGGTVTHTAVNVADTTTQIVAASTTRRYLLIQNDSDTAVYIKLGAAGVLHEGILLAANGGAYESSPGADLLFMGAINGIHGGSGSKVVLVTEGTS
jgi:hypothetical protein